MDINPKNEEILAAIADPDQPHTKLLIAEGVSYRDVVHSATIERDIYKAEELSDEIIRMKALDLACACATRLFREKLTDGEIIRTAALFATYVQYGEMPAEPTSEEL